MTFPDLQAVLRAGPEKYCEAVFPELDKAYRATMEVVDDSPPVIEEQMETLSEHLARVHNILATAGCFVDIQTYEKRADGRCSYVEQQLKNNYATRHIRFIKHKAYGLVQSIEKRITVLQSRLKSSRDDLSYRTPRDNVKKQNQNEI